MPIDELAGRSLAALTDHLKPMPDAYGRVVARARRQQRRQRAALGVAVAAVSVLTAVALVPAGRRPPEPGQEQNYLLAWNRRLLDSPTRGTVGQDAAYVGDFARRVLERMRANGYERKWGVSRVKVIFLDDVGAKRVAHVAFLLTEPHPGVDWPYTSAWFVADRGAAPETLAVTTNAIGDGLEPVATDVISDAVGGPRYIVSVAPAQCHFETAPLPEANVWTPEPTGSYIVRVPETERPEWWRVVCDGVVRKEEGAPGGVYEDRLLPAEVTEALATARGQVDPGSAAMNLGMAMKGYATLGKPKVLWGGQISGSEPDGGLVLDGTAVVAVVRAVRGGWFGSVQINYDRQDANGSTGAGVEFGTRDDPLAPGTVLAIRLSRQTRDVLVLPPAGGARVQAVDRRGNVVAEARVSQDAALLRVPDPAEAEYVALDETGAILGRAGLAGEAALGAIDRFGEP